MPRPPRIDLGDYVYHVINRSNGRVRIFHTDSDYAEFEYFLNEIRETYKMRILAYVIMPNHWHMLLYPRADGDMSKALQWLGTTHARRFHVSRKTVGGGHLYQGRYKSFLVENDWHLLSVLKYIERNPVRAKLVKNVEEWRWSSAHKRVYGTAKQRRLFSESPVELPRNYRVWINTPEESELLEMLRRSVNKGVTFGQVSLPDSR